MVSSNNGGMNMLRNVVLSCLFLFGGLSAAMASDFDPGRVGFHVSVNDVQIDYEVFALMVMPGASLTFETSRPTQLISPDPVIQVLQTSWTWQAPSEPGTHTIALKAGDESITLHLFVLEPAINKVGDSLAGYRIGYYRDQPLRGLPNYVKPKGFIRVTQQNRKLRVSPHFTLEQFLCKQESDWPKLIVLQPQLLLKLERVLEEVNRTGIRTDSFTIMSGFRTPWYNRNIGNRTTSSRHVYGGAADIFIDVNPRDGQMDDLNGDGVINKKDADYLYDLLQGWTAKPWWKPLVGGMASYKTTHAHGPFIHLDERGYPARWNR
jgi:hypothetical protein